MSLQTMNWITLLVLWTVIGRGVFDSAQARKRSRQRALWELTEEELVKESGLSKLQIQVALEDANTCFNLRIAELQRSVRG